MPASDVQMLLSYMKWDKAKLVDQLTATEEIERNGLFAKAIVVNVVDEPERQSVTCGICSAQKVYMKALTDFFSNLHT